MTASPPHTSSPAPETLAAPRSYDAALGLLVDQARASAASVPHDAVARLMDLVRRARHVVIFGRGRSGLVARTFAVRLGHLGFRAYFVGETSTPPVSEEDLVLLVSGSGETFSVTLTGKIARDLGATVACITADVDSPLAELADHLIQLPFERGDDQARLAPLGTVFELASHIFFDAVVAELVEALGETESSMQGRHATLE